MMVGLFPQYFQNERKFRACLANFRASYWFKSKKPSRPSLQA